MSLPDLGAVTMPKAPAPSQPRRPPLCTRCDPALFVQMRRTLQECVLAAGAILLRHFGRTTWVRQKRDPSSVVTDADLASEQWLMKRIHSRFPEHGVIAEETGYRRQASEFTWVIDPLDGTSNFVAGLPWFGVQIAVLQNHVPILAAMFLPVTGTLYSAERGKGVYRDRTRVHVTRESALNNVLCAIGLDAAASGSQNRWQANILHRVSHAVRNVRATNCLLDFCFTIDGRLGGCLNFNTKIWDIAPLCLMLPEAGGKVTDLTGRSIAFRPDVEPFDRDYAVLGANSSLHRRLLTLVR